MFFPRPTSLGLAALLVLVAAPEAGARLFITPSDRVAVGGDHVCAINSANALQCWGQNSSGQLGIGANVAFDSTPNFVAGLGGNVIAAVAAGAAHTCALIAGENFELLGGSVKCWGANDAGQLGDGTVTDRLAPVEVGLLGGGAVALVAGSKHTCALLALGEVRCWGDNGNGQLGVAGISRATSPTIVGGLALGSQSLSARNNITCAVTSGSGVKCWGFGFGSTAVEGPWGPGIVEVAVGAGHICARNSQGLMSCYGDNTVGQLGTGTRGGRSDLVVGVGLPGSGGLQGVTRMRLGSELSCALLNTRDLVCWGRTSALEALVGSGPLDVNSPVLVKGYDTDVIAFDLSDSVVCARYRSTDATGELKCSGLNSNGQLGNGTFDSTRVPFSVASTQATQVTITVTKSSLFNATASGTVTSAPLGIECGSDCSETFLGGAFVTLSARPALDSAMQGWEPVGICPPVLVLEAGSPPPCTIAASRTRTLTAVFRPASDSEKFRNVVRSYYRTILGREPDPDGLDFWSNEADRVLKLPGDIREAFYAMAIEFFSGAEYRARNRSDTEYVGDLYRTFYFREPDLAGLDYWLGQLGQVQSRSAVLNSFIFAPEFTSVMTSLFGGLIGGIRPEVNLTMDFFRGVFGRLPDNAGFTFWRDQLRRAQCDGVAQASGAPVNAKTIEVANLFFGSAEYARRGRGDRDFMGDVYSTYLRRGPGGDATGFNFWVSEATRTNRDTVRGQFVPSPEFQARVTSIIGAGCLTSGAL